MALKFELFDFHFAEAFQFFDLCFEIFGGGVCGYGFGVAPSFAKHEDIGTGAALKHVVGDATFVLLAGGGQREGSFEGCIILAFVGLKKTIDANHKKND